MTDNIDIAVRDSGTPVVTRNLEKVGEAASKSAGSVDLLKSALYALGAVLAVDKLMQWADTWNSVEGLIRTSTKSMSESKAVMDRIYEAAQKTRTPLGEMGDLYTSIARAGGTLGASQEQVIKFSEGVGKALAIQHTTANQARGALIQLGQAVGMGSIRAQEYNSLLQNGQVILQTVAQNMEGVDGSITKLTAKVKGGHVTSKEFFDAFLAGADSLDGRFSQTSFLFSQAFTVMGNSMARYLGKLDQSLGISTKFVTFIKWVGDNMPIAAGVVLGFGTALAVALSPLVVTTFIGYMQALYALILANPFTAFAALIAGVAVAVYTMRDAINLGLGDATTLGDLLTSVWADVVNKFSNLGSFISAVFEQMTLSATDNSKETKGVVATAAEGMKQDFHDFFADTGDGWLGWLRGAAKVIDAIIGFLGGAVIFMKDAFLEGIDYVINLFNRANNAAGEFGAKVQNAMIDAANVMREAAGLELIPHVNWDPIKTKGADEFRSMGQIWADSMDTGFKTTSENGLGSWLDDRIKLAQGIRASKGVDKPASLTDPMGTYTPPVDPSASDKAAKALARLNDELERTIGKINPVLAAKKELAQAEDVFARAVAAGLIPQAEADKYLGMLKTDLADALDPLKHMNEQLDLKAKTLGMNNREAAIEEELYGRTEALRRKGVILTTEEVAALRAKLVVQQELNRIAQARDQIEGQTGVEKMNDFQIQLTAMQQLLSSGKMGAGDVAGQLSSMFPWANISQTQEQMDAFVQQHADMYDKIAALENAGVIKHQTAEMLKHQADAQFMEQRLAGQRAFFGSLAGLMSSSNKKLFAIGKAAAITQATIDGVLAVQKAYAGSPYPWNIAAAVAQGVIAAANVANIASQQPPGFRTGGSMTVGGSGGDDSQLVQFRATPGERVTINTPSQARALERGQADSKPTVVQPKVAVFMDKDLMHDFLNSDEGGDAMQVWMSRNGYEPAH